MRACAACLCSAGVSASFLCVFFTSELSPSLNGWLAAFDLKILSGLYEIGFVSFCLLLHFCFIQLI